MSSCWKPVGQFLKNVSMSLPMFVSSPHEKPGQECSQQCCDDPDLGASRSLSAGHLYSGQSRPATEGADHRRGGTDRRPRKRRHVARCRSCDISGKGKTVESSLPAPGAGGGLRRGVGLFWGDRRLLQLDGVMVVQLYKFDKTKQVHSYSR